MDMLLSISYLIILVSSLKTLLSIYMYKQQRCVCEKTATHAITGSFNNHAKVYVGLGFGMQFCILPI